MRFAIAIVATKASKGKKKGMLRGLTCRSWSHWFSAPRQATQSRQAAAQPSAADTRQPVTRLAAEPAA